jgi:Fe-S-cluster-containing dehydrogenase component
MKYEFEFRTGTVSIDHDGCTECATHACVEACGLCGGRILRLQEGRPVLGVGADDVRRRCVECLACEYACFIEGKNAITIVLPIAGLDEFRSCDRGNTP